MFVKITCSNRDHDFNDFGLIVNFEYTLSLPNNETAKAIIKITYDEDNITKRTEIKNDINRTTSTLRRMDKNRFTSSFSPMYLSEEEESNYLKLTDEDKKIYLKNWLEDAYLKTKHLNENLIKESLLKTFEVRLFEYEFFILKNNGWVSVSKDCLYRFFAKDFELTSSKSIRASIDLFTEINNVDCLTKKFILNKISRVLDLNPVFSF